MPGLRLIVAGPLAAALVGASAGGLVGALVGYGIPEEHAKAYESGIKEGGIMLRATLRNTEDANFLENKWQECGGERVYSSARQQTATTATATAKRETNMRDTSGNQVAIPVIEEELQVGTRAVMRGGVHVETHIEERPVEKTVTLREEHINVERHPVDRAVSEADLRNVKEGAIELTAKSQEAVVAKQARVVEEVLINKNVTEREKTIQDTVRRTDVEVEKIPQERGKGAA